jgi:hypothetical protein
VLRPRGSSTQACFRVVSEALRSAARAGRHLDRGRGGDRECGDLLANILGGPGLEFFIDDLVAATKSVERLRKMDAGTVYPGHGKAFDFARLNFRA